MSLSVTSPASTTSRSMARARPTASSSRASGVRGSPCCARAAAARAGACFSHGSMTIARPLPAPYDVGLSGSLRSRWRCSNLNFIRAGLFAAFEQLDRMPRHDGRDRVLVDELGMPVPPQQHAEVIEPGDNALQLHSVHQKDGEGNFGFADVVEEGVLQILRTIGGHGRWFHFSARVFKRGTVVAGPLGGVRMP